MPIVFEYSCIGLHIVAQYKLYIQYWLYSYFVECFLITNCTSTTIMSVLWYSSFDVTCCDNLAQIFWHQILQHSSTHSLMSYAAIFNVKWWCTWAQIISMSSCDSKFRYMLAFLNTNYKHVWLWFLITACLVGAFAFKFDSSSLITLTSFTLA